MRSILIATSIFPGVNQAILEMRQYTKTGARIMKLYPTVQKFYPDEQKVIDIYAEAERLNLVIFFHGGRAGIEIANASINL